MALYELRTYTLYVGKMAEATKLHQEIGYPALDKGGHARKLMGYFQADTGMINQLVHLWKFDDDADRSTACNLLARFISTISCGTAQREGWSRRSHALQPPPLALCQYYGQL